MESYPADRTDIKQYNISDLPPEILPNIFKFLSIRERKAVKLVNRLWFENCDELSSNDEFLSCVGFYKLADIYELLSKSARKFLNLKFEFVNFHDDSSFWENNGWRIRSITFKDCQFSKGLDEIIVFCPNLVNLSFIYTSELPSNARNSILHYLRFFANFEKLLKDGIVRENLNSLKIYIRVHTRIVLSDQCTCQLFSIFPKLKILKMNFPEIFCYNFQSLDDLSTEYSDPSKVSDTEFKFGSVLNYLTRNKDRIETLKLYFPQSFPKIPASMDSVRCILGVLQTMNRLTKLSINLGRYLQQEDLERFLQSKPLKSFVFARWDRVPVSLGPLLTNNSRLEHLKIWGACPIDPLIATKPLLEKLMSSGLKSCRMFMVNRILVDDPDSFRSEFSVQMRLSTSPNLSVDICRSGPWERRVEMVPFLRYARNILHLRLDNGSYEELLTLLEYQKNLKSLIMRDEEKYRMDVPEDSVDVFRNTFYHLTKLEHLELGYSMAILFLSSVSPGSTILTNLKYLKINRPCYEENTEISSSDLLKIADVTPHLEGLYISYGKAVPVDISVKLCSKLSRLQFLRWDVHEIREDDTYSDEDYRNIFTACPSLRVVCRCIFLVWPDSPRSVVYLYDTINQKVVPLLQRVPYVTASDRGYDSLIPLENRNILYTFAEPRIARYAVDWLKY